MRDVLDKLVRVLRVLLDFFRESLMGALSWGRM